MNIYRFDLNTTMESHICICAQDLEECKDRLKYAMDDVVKKAEAYLRDMSNWELNIENQINDKEYV